MKIRLPDVAFVYGEQKQLLYTSSTPDTSSEIKLTFSIQNDVLATEVTAEETPLCYVVLKWRFHDFEKRSESVRVLSDAWERAYGEQEWRGIVPERWMPWYFLVSNGSDSASDCKGRHTEGFGVKVRPSSFCLWQYDKSGVTLCMDVRCGAKGMILGGRTLRASEVIFGDFCDCTAYQSGQDFCRAMCDDPIFPKKPIYGFNNWYYAYGKSSSEKILEDAKRLAEYTKGLKNRPYMVIDDGWQPNFNDGPWDCGHPTLFPDMQALAAKIREHDVIPGIWIRPWVQKAEYDLPARGPRLCQRNRSSDRGLGL